MKNYCVELLWTFNQTRLNRWIFPVENSRTDAAESNGFHRVVVIVKSEKPVRRHIYLKPTHVSMNLHELLAAVTFLAKVTTVALVLDSPLLSNMNLLYAPKQVISILCIS